MMTATTTRTTATLVCPQGMQRFDFTTTPRGRAAGLVTITRWDPEPTHGSHWELAPSRVFTTDEKEGREWWKRLRRDGFKRTA
jgi:hypothetical protein